jgi:hypothetical protein
MYTGMVPGAKMEIPAQILGIKAMNVSRLAT